MRHHILARCAVLALIVSACGSDAEPTGDLTPRLTLMPPQATSGGPGSRVTVGAEVQGLGSSPTITWTSLAPAAVVVESVRDAGRTAVLRFDQPTATYVIVMARGTHTLVDTLIITIPVARSTE